MVQGWSFCFLTLITPHREGIIPYPPVTTTNHLTVGKKGRVAVVACIYHPTTMVYINCVPFASKSNTPYTEIMNLRRAAYDTNKLVGQLEKC